MTDDNVIDVKFGSKDVELELEENGAFSYIVRGRTRISGYATPNKGRTELQTFQINSLEFLPQAIRALALLVPGPLFTRPISWKMTLAYSLLGFTDDGTGDFVREEGTWPSTDELKAISRKIS